MFKIKFQPSCIKNHRRCLIVAKKEKLFKMYILRDYNNTHPINYYILIIN